MVLDMAQFTRSVQVHGVLHFLARIGRMRRIVAGAVAVHGGLAVKFDADNAFVLFDRAADALAAAVAINHACASAECHDDDAIRVGIGLARGRLLLVEDGTDLYGDCVNVAAKLGEDFAGPGEILMTGEVRDEIASGCALDLVETEFEIAARAVRGFRTAC